MSEVFLGWGRHPERAPTRDAPTPGRAHNTRRARSSFRHASAKGGRKGGSREPPLHRRAPTRGCPYTGQAHDTPAVPGPPSAMRRQWGDARAVHEPPPTPKGTHKGMPLHQTGLWHTRRARSSFCHASAMGGRKGGSRTAPTPKGHPQGDAPTPGGHMTPPPDAPRIIRRIRSAGDVLCHSTLT